MMCLGEAAKSPGVIERPVQHIDLCPTIAGFYKLNNIEFSGNALPGLAT
jgi:hypothetical protein